MMSNAHVQPSLQHPRHILHVCVCVWQLKTLKSTLKVDLAQFPTQLFKVADIVVNRARAQINVGETKIKQASEQRLWRAANSLEFTFK